MTALLRRAVGAVALTVLAVLGLAAPASAESAYDLEPWLGDNGYPWGPYVPPGPYQPPVGMAYGPAAALPAYGAPAPWPAAPPACAAAPPVPEGTRLPPR